MNKQEILAALESLRQFVEPKYNSLDAKTPALAQDQFALVEFEELVYNLRKQRIFEVKLDDGVTVYVNEVTYERIPIIDDTTGEVLGIKRRAIKRDEKKEFMDLKDAMLAKYQHSIQNHVELSEEDKQIIRDIRDKEKRMGWFISLRYAPAKPTVEQPKVEEPAVEA